MFPESTKNDEVLDKIKLIYYNIFIHLWSIVSQNT